MKIGFHTDAFNSSYKSFEGCLQWAQQNHVHFIECGLIVNWKRFLLAFCCLAACGCESLSNAGHRVRDRVAGRDESRTRAFAANQRATYDAVRATAQQMGYRFVRGGAAQGEFEAVSGVGRGDTAHSARQLAMKARLEPNLEGGTQVSVRFTEIIEADSSNRPGMATETPLRDTPQYEVFFRTIERVLGTQPVK